MGTKFLNCHTTLCMDETEVIAVQAGNKYEVIFEEELANELHYAIIDEQGEEHYFSKDCVKELFTVEVKLNEVEEIYESIVEWQYDAGEDFLDYFDSEVNIGNLLFWCLGKSYITKEQFNLWEKGMCSTSPLEKLKASTLSLVHNCHGDDKPYALVSEDDWTEEGQEKAYMILAEFISVSDTYKKRLSNFLTEN